MTSSIASPLRRLLAVVLVAVTASTASATIFTVVNTADTGAGSLRAALTSAQTCAGGPHTIAFDVPLIDLTGGVAVITPSSTPLPALTCAGTTIDGTTQTTNKGNTNNVTLGSGGTVGTGADGRTGTGDEPALPQLNGPEVEIVGTNLTSGILDVAADSVTIKGLSLHGGGDFGGNGTGSGTIQILSGTGTSIQGNVIGAGATSYSEPAAQTQDNLVLINGGTNHVIQQNLMGFCRWRMILMFAPTGTVTIQDNELTGSPDGIDFSSPGFGPTGTVTITRNFIHHKDAQGNATTPFGIFVTQTGAGSADITENTVLAVENGVMIDASRPLVIARNVISGGGIFHFLGAMAITISKNSIFDNSGPGIDLGSGGVTPNDGIVQPMDYPVFTAASQSGGNLTVAGFVGNNAGGSALFANATIEIFKADNDPANQRGQIVTGDGRNASHGEGAVFLGAMTADAMGLFSGMIPVPAGVTLLAGDPITATATLLGNSSEFGPNAHQPSVLDIDANGATDPLTDGILALRFFFGFTGSTLINSAVGGGCMRCTADAIASHITTLDLVLDIDDNDDAAPLTDGLLVLRYLFGFTGSTLTSGAISGNCGRCDASTIVPYLQTLDP